jgi:hypothetical protein
MTLYEMGIYIKTLRILFRMNRSCQNILLWFVFDKYWNHRRSSEYEFPHYYMASQSCTFETWLKEKGKYSRRVLETIE